MPKVAVIGITTWGITLGVVLARKGIRVKLWARTEEEALELRRASEESSLLSGFTLPPQVLVTSLLDEALAGTKAVIMAVPIVLK